MGVESYIYQLGLGSTVTYSLYFDQCGISVIFCNCYEKKYLERVVKATLNCRYKDKCLEDRIYIG